MSKCLYCYQELGEGQTDFHPVCAKKIFGTPIAPELPYSRANINELAKTIIMNKTTLTGVQAKLSMDINKGGRDEPARLTIVGLWGRYILKPKSETYPWLPEDEDLTMHLAEIARIKVVPHSLIRFNDGELAYITQRIDRDKKGNKLLMEDTCQLSERLTADKYKSSHERISKLIKQYSSAPKLDLVNYWELVVFSWLTGNSDMHMKNFSLISPARGQYTLSPAYDLLNVHLIFNDPEDLALTLDGKKSHLDGQNFIHAMTSSGLDEVVIHNIFKKFETAAPKWFDFIEISFLPDELKEKYKKELSEKLSKLKG